MVALTALLLAASAARALEAPLVDQGVPRLLDRVLGSSRLPEPGVDPSRLPSALRVITGEEARRWGARSVQEVLERLPGVVLYDAAGNGLQSTLDLRGFNASPVPATVVTLDGVRVNEPDFGTVNFHLIPVDRIERIEVVPGPSTMLGKNALAGAIHIVTRRALQPTAEAGTEFGSYGRQVYSTRLGGPLGDWDYSVAARRLLEDGYRRGADANIHQLRAALGYRKGKTDASLAFDWADDRLRQPGSLTPREIDADRRQNVSFVSMDSLLNAATLNLRGDPLDGFSLAANAFVRHRLENTPLNRGRTSVSQSRSDMNSLGATLQASRDARLGERRHLLTAGAEYARHRVDSGSSGSFGGFPFLSHSLADQGQLGLFVQESLDLLPGALVLNAGVRYDDDMLQFSDLATPANNGTRSYHRASSRAGLNWDPTRSVGLYASFSESFRSPTVNEISSLGPFQSTPDLKPVKARSVETGARLSFGPWGDASLSAFRAVVKDEIYPVFDPTAGFGQNRNIDKTRRQGVELTLRPRWGPLEGRAQYGYTEATFQTAFVLDKAPFPTTQSVQPGDSIPQVPRQRLAVGADLRLPRGARISVDELCVGSQPLFGDEANDEARLSGYCTLDAGLLWEAAGWSVFVRGTNVLGRQYASRGILGTDPATFQLQRFLVPAQTAAVSGGVSWRWGGG